ncbi:MAG: hypothetical protein V4437_01930 [Patescibacteria group bacterium]
MNETVSYTRDRRPIRGGAGTGGSVLVGETMSLDVQARELRHVADARRRKGIPGAMFFDRMADAIRPRK